MLFYYIIELLYCLLSLCNIKIHHTHYYTWTSTLHRCHTGILRPPFEPHSQEESNGGNFVSIWPLDGEKVKKILKYHNKRTLVKSANSTQY